MSEASCLTPGFLETVNLAIDRILLEVHTSMPGKIVSYDRSKQTATVQPALKVKYADQAEAQPLPEIQNVPVIFPSVAGGWMLLPMAAGDNVDLHFAERSIDQWFENGGVVDPMIPAKFQLTDCIATPGLNPSNAAIVPKGAATSIEIATAGGWIEITATGKFKITNGSVELLTVLDSILTHLIALSTTNAVVGSPCLLSLATIAQLTADQVQLDLLKA